MNYINRNWILFLVVALSVILNVYLFIAIINKSISQSYQDAGLLSCSKIIKAQEMLLEFFLKGMDKEDVVHSLDKILEQQGSAELFIAEKHENLIIFSDTNFYFNKNKLEEITTENLDEKFNIKY